MAPLSLCASLGIGRPEQELWPLIHFDFETNAFFQENTVIGKLHPLRLMSFTQLRQPGTPVVPHLSPEDASLELIIRRLQELLQIRPVASAQCLWNKLEFRCDIDNFYRAPPYCSYVFQDVLWKGALIRFDVDPRQDPVYRKYQTIYLPINYDPIVFRADGIINLIVGFPPHRAAHRQCHIFDGQTIIAGIQSWQLCDVIGNQLPRVVSTENLRKAPHSTTSFFFDGTWAKMWEIMRDKLICLRDNCPLPNDDYEKLLRSQMNTTTMAKRTESGMDFEFGEADTQKNGFLRRTILKRIRSLKLEP
ncbi:hypothetical protein BJY01DRAFT_247136 [Aspergillus pseudoustus]|uniref:Transcription factor IIIC subunit 5 HTH domain-containing protein n=1 Tax=Aspergillus pseudoustus TaxID=1810923 RepID=A0ABR4K3B1_9EURO